MALLEAFDLIQNGGQHGRHLRFNSNFEIPPPQKKKIAEIMKKSSY